MTAEIISGTAIAQELRNQLLSDIKSLANQDIVPGLAVVLVGNNPASRTYVKNKQKACEKLGIESRLVEMEEAASEQELLEVIKELNNDKAIDGILVQLPLPPHIDETKVIEAISPEKDVDGFHPINIGRMMTGQACFLPCTPFGIIKMFESIDYSLSGKHVVVIGRSNIVGKPMGQLCLSKNATVTYCHSKTPDLKEFTTQADVVISAVGKTGLITKDHIKEGAVVIDVAMNRDENGKLCGDVLFDEVKEKASYITPVPGGVGPMTITMLLYNTVQSAKAKL
ncbi:MAG TPA: bifunctional methylenetetrahydrofolate dehydrogenase/methenyltetrahydrofolate cyclohydrolase FolD [Bacillus sp. (in: firmicutes)]|uniref:bifunctional methylenetetrahydrofolate dehydrogenase/methenyltetrahydrofolate cyclohydrolase FolD n=1 Tax=Bacillus litorisediminis TaxID=2922713 RepID=UPI001FAF774E|nr:bifunctional methylenetetrahydrofolate dehydrogenase/methenyltetrahydrofolate cyclohydrolase FolD [Bacillus litorisediminis]HWO76223.1 bifunctional methylenetetrahydrofolate dehydrogenase/methenyltetrahydrofolate cyclohydrolase FolD [Bacillus sp. (in: firmicutes)]